MWLLAIWYESASAVVVAVLTALGSLFLLLRALPMDKDAKRIASEAAEDADEERTIKRLEKYILLLQKDNKTLRENEERRDKRIEDMQERIDTMQARIYKLESIINKAV